jgi:hypothetical protein
MLDVAPLDLRKIVRSCKTELSCEAGGEKPVCSNKGFRKPEFEEGRPRKREDWSQAHAAIRQTGEPE